MKKIIKFVPTYIAFFLILGIFAGYYFAVNQFAILMILLIEIVVLVLLYFSIKQQNQLSIYFTLLIYFTSITLGILTITFKNQLNSKHHFYHFIDKKSSTENIRNQKHILKVEIKKVLKPGYNQHKYMAKVVEVNNQKCMGKVLLNIQADSLTKLFDVDQTLLIYTDFKPIEPPKNPHYFDYQKHLQKQQIHHQILVSKDEFKLLHSTATVIGLAAQLRAKINQKLAFYAIGKAELAVINALLLGQRQDISKDLMESYANAGAIHILAVSGLHIGIILMILHFLLRPLERLKNGKLWKMFLLVLLLWIYAVIAGLSASVVRAVMMFSILAIGMNLNKITNTFYTLILSLLILLLINPYFLFDVGFQLSYAAVFSIVIFQPIFQSFWVAKNRFLQFYWNLITVSIAAQIGILPISLYYFHQFPGLFILTNLIIIPFLGIILMGGILIFFLALLNTLPSIAITIYTKLIFLMNVVVKRIAAQESFLIKEISFDFWMLISFFIIIIFSLIYIKSRNSNRLKLVLISIIGFQMVLFLTKWKTENTHELVVFHKSKQSIIGEKVGNQITFYTDLDTASINKEKFLTGYQIGNSINKIKVENAKNIFYSNHRLILVVDKSAIYQIDKIKPDVIILQNSPKINLNRLIDALNPAQIIADGSNHTSYVNLWAATCEKRKTPFHHTGQKGAYILKNN
ncbi:MAG: ComEC/Rec2 family competence protein [Flavobacteriaceae bacterium]|nr:ComEC/Rec2 family competence protein [Flavobacteriaceae bacterium]